MHQASADGCWQLVKLCRSNLCLDSELMLDHRVRADSARQRHAIINAYLAERGSAAHDGRIGGPILQAERELSLDTARAWVSAHLDARRLAAAGRQHHAPTFARVAAAMAIASPKERRDRIIATSKARAASARHWQAEKRSHELEAQSGAFWASVGASACARASLTHAPSTAELALREARLAGWDQRRAQEEAHWHAVHAFDEAVAAQAASAVHADAPRCDGASCASCAPAGCAADPYMAAAACCCAGIAPLLLSTGSPVKAVASPPVALAAADRSSMHRATGTPAGVAAEGLSVGQASAG